MKKSVLAFLFVLGILYVFSCTSTPTSREAEENQTEEVETDTLDYELLEEEEGL